MEAVIQLTEPPPGGPGSGAPHEVAQAVAALGLDLQPVHPGSTDPTLTRYFRVPVGDRPTAERAVAAVAGLGAVAAAYVKPSAEPA